MFDWIYLISEGIEDFMEIGSDKVNEKQTVTHRIPVDVYHMVLTRGLTIKPSIDYEVGGLIDGIIYLNPEMSLERRRFVMAHCLAHEILGTTTNLPEKIENFREHIGGIEHQANNLALDILIPESTLLQIVRKGNVNVAGLAEYFQVSQVAMGSKLAKIMENRK